MASRAVRHSGRVAVRAMLGALVGCSALWFTRPLGAQSFVVHTHAVKFASGGDSIDAYLAVPEHNAAVPAVLVIPDESGLSDAARAQAERLAKSGFVALAPDLLTRRGGTPPNPDQARRLIASLNADTITQDLNAAVAYLGSLPDVRRADIGVIGFGWGGGESFRYATNNPNLTAFVVCYGPAPKPSELARIHAHGYGVYADRDVRINQGLFDLSLALDHAHVQYRFKVYPGVRSGFLGADEQRKAADDAWKAITLFFRQELGS